MNDVLILALPRAEGARALACFFVSGKENPCPSLVEAAAGLAWRAGPPASLPRERSGLTLPGRTYEPPPGCRGQARPNGFYVTCSDQTSFGWAQLPAGMSLYEGARAGLAKVATLHEEQRDCTVEGVHTRCTVFVAAECDPDRSSMILAELTMGGKSIAATCVSRNDVPPVPAVCASAISVAPAAPRAVATVADPATLTFAGRPVRVPESCHLERSAGDPVVACETGALLSWTAFESEAQATRMLETYGNALASGVGARASKVSCRIGGLPTTCNRHAVQRGGGTARTYLSGVVQVGSSPTFAVCAVPGGDLASAPCPELFEVDGE
jgi:hypothetical protein